MDKEVLGAQDRCFRFRHLVSFFTQTVKGWSRQANPHLRCRLGPAWTVNRLKELADTRPARGPDAGRSVCPGCGQRRGAGERIRGDAGVNAKAPRSTLGCLGCASLGFINHRDRRAGWERMGSGASLSQAEHLAVLGRGREPLRKHALQGPSRDEAGTVASFLPAAEPWGTPPPATGKRAGEHFSGSPHLPSPRAQQLREGSGKWGQQLPRVQTQNPGRVPGSGSPLCGGRHTGLKEKM